MYCENPLQRARIMHLLALGYTILEWRGSEVYLTREGRKVRITYDGMVWA